MIKICKVFCGSLLQHSLYIRLARFLETAGSVLNYFEPFLGRIEILGGGKRIERVYFEIKESNIEQWEKPQIKVRNISIVLVFIWIPIKLYWCSLSVGLLQPEHGALRPLPHTSSWCNT
jgi:hypothetical protein